MIMKVARGPFYVYILSNHNRTVLYIGITNDLRRRLGEHRMGRESSFVHRYNLRDLVYFEEFAEPYGAIRREKQLKNWHRESKFGLIRRVNPNLRDVSDDLPL